VNQHNKEIEMAAKNSKELIDILKDIERHLLDIKYDLADVKREMPKVPYYGDLLQDIVEAIKDMSK